MPNISIMIKPASGSCNMRCKYCFYHSLTNMREISNYGVMSISTAQRVIDCALQLANGDSVYFAFQGGEPLLAGKEYFKEFTDYVKKRNVNNAAITYALQTNGTLIDDEWAELFKTNSFLIGLSLDGDKDNNLYRMDADYAPVFNKVDAAANLLQKTGVDFNILSVVTGHSANNIEQIYRYFTSRGYKYLQFIPCLRPFGDDSESPLYMTPSQYEEYLIRLFNLYVKDYVDGHYTSIRHFDNMVRLFLGQRAEQCGMEGHCARQFVVEANGNVYPCDFYCVDEWLLGNIADKDFYQLAHSQKAIDFIKESLPIEDKCKSCYFYRVCRGGGCKRSRQDRDYCSAYKSFFSKCLPLFRVFMAEK
ncbi:MAG: radical SAM protein [Clostridia bacterium]|nr:radical SAM protein [Clostridia bacterium]